VSTPAHLESAVFEFHRYLSDGVAPLMVVDEVTLLLENSPEILAMETMRWIDETGRPKTDRACAEFQMLAVRKLAQMGEFDLVPRPSLRAYLNDYGQELVIHCPPPERGFFIETLGTYAESLLAPNGLLAQTAKEMAPPPASVRMATFLDQLSRETEGERRDEVASEFMASAALGAVSREALDESLAPLRGVGIDPATENVLNSIARNLPGWGTIEDPSGVSPTSSERLGAMRNIVSLGEDDAEIAKRFRELVHAAIAQFNTGNLGRAQSILGLATQMVEDGHVKPEFVESLRGASAYLDQEQLKAATEQTSSYPALRSIMSFFTSLAPEGLIHSLRAESEEGARRELESLLEVHGPAARAQALQVLAAEPTTSPAGFLSSLLRVVRRIPRPAGPAGTEADMIVRFAGRGIDPHVATQAIYCLGQSSGDRTDRALVGLLRTYEGLLARSTPTSTPTAEEVSDLAARTCDALAQTATPRGLSAMVDHGLKMTKELGDCAARLAEASKVDFAAHPELLTRLLDALKGELPRAVLGVHLRKDLHRATALARALSGTVHPEVRSVFEKIHKGHREEELGKVAGDALEAWNAKSRPHEAPQASTLSGDLGFFGLPMLLQTLEQGAMTGCLSLIDRTGQPLAQVWIDSGRMVKASFRGLEADAALYEMLIRPFPGTFSFVHRSDVPEPGPRGAFSVTGLVFEGIRRYDEWKKAAALVGDHAHLIPTDKPHEIELESETAEFISEVWAKASQGATPAQCEATLGADSYRIRRVLSAWVESGALKLAA
jgi:hypothetical protein